MQAYSVRTWTDADPIMFARSCKRGIRHAPFGCRRYGRRSRAGRKTPIN